MVQFGARYERWLAIGLLALMLVLGICSMRGDSAIVDEVAHIPSGYSYLRYGDFRLNPEHPPLIKDIAAAPLLLVPNLEFPLDHKAWTTDPNGQWESGWHFLYHYGNDPDLILFWSRLPILLLAIGLGWVIYSFTKKHFGKRVAILATFLYALEPNILAHSRFVTTDLGIAAFNVFAFIGIWRWLKKPNWKNLLLAGGLFGLAQLAKFSAILLIPFIGLMVVIWIITAKEPKKFWPRVWKYGFGLAGIFAVGFALVWLVYIPHTINMPEAVQDKLITASLPGGWPHRAGELLVDVNHLPGMRPLSQYLLGVLMVVNRVDGGNTTYFLGEVTNQSFAAYFPVTYLFKTPLPLIILAMMSGLTGAFLYFRRKPLAVWHKFRDYAREHFIELTSLLYIGYYSYLSVTGNLNLGIRHLLPIMPFVIILVSVCTVKAYGHLKGKFNKAFGYAMLAALLGWYAIGSLAAYPAYVAYFNELIGGGGNAHKYFTDSSVDWGQDLIRLKKYVDARPEIDQIAVDYFGGGDPRYYFCRRKLDEAGALIKSAAGYDCSKSKYVEWHAEQGIPGTKYFAVSETFLMNDLYYAPKRGDSGYEAIRDLTPTAKIGNSIYVYKLR